MDDGERNYKVDETLFYCRLKYRLPQRMHDTFHLRLLNLHCFAEESVHQVFRLNVYERHMKETHQLYPFESEPAMKHILLKRKDDLDLVTIDYRYSKLTNLCY